MYLSGSRGCLCVLISACYQKLVRFCYECIIQVDWFEVLWFKATIPRIILGVTRVEQAVESSVLLTDVLNIADLGCRRTFSWRKGHWRLSDPQSDGAALVQ